MEGTGTQSVYLCVSVCEREREREGKRKRAGRYIEVDDLE